MRTEEARTGAALKVGLFLFALNAGGLGIASRAAGAWRAGGAGAPMPFPSRGAPDASYPAWLVLVMSAGFVGVTVVGGIALLVARRRRMP